MRDMSERIAIGLGVHSSVLEQKWDFLSIDTRTRTTMRVLRR